MPQRRGYYDGGGRRSGSFNEWFNLARMIRDQVTGEDRRQQQMSREVESLELEEAQAKVKGIKDRQISQERQFRLQALEANRQGDIEAAGALQGTPGPSLASMMGGQRQAQMGGEAGTMMNLPTEPGGMQLLPVQGGATMDLPIPDVQLPHKMMQVRGIQMPEAGVDVPGYETRPLTTQQMLQQQKEAQAVEDMVPVPEELRQLASTIPGLSELPAEIHVDLLKALVARVVSQSGMNIRQEKQLGATAEQGALTRGSREKIAGAGITGRAELQGKKLGATAVEGAAKRASRESEGAKSRASREKIAADRLAASGGGDDLKATNKTLEGMGLPPIEEPSTARPGETGLDLPGRAFASAHTPTGIQVRSKGNGETITEALAKKYLAAAKGDRALAEQWLTEDGWKPPRAVGK